MQRDPYAGIARPEDDEEDPYAGIARMEDGERRNNRFQIARRATYDFFQDAADRLAPVPVIGQGASALVRGGSEIALGDRTRSATPGASGAALNAYLWGAGNEAQGGLAAAVQPIRSAMGEQGVSPGQAYVNQSQAAQAELDRQRAEAPVSTMALEGVTGALNPLNVLGAGYISRGSGLLGGALRSAAVGAPVGATVGFFEDRGGVLDRLDGAAFGAGAGAILGGGAPLIVDGTSRLGMATVRFGARAYRNLRGNRPLSGEQAGAWSMILREAQEAGLSEQDIMRRLDDLERAGLDDEQAMFELLGGNAVERARGGVVTGNPSALQGRDRINARQTRQPQRVEQRLREGLGSDGSEFEGVREALDSPTPRETELYNQFREQPGVERLGPVLRDEAGRPQRYFHGTTEDFAEFSDAARGSSTRANSARLGHFFTDDPFEAAGYADLSATNRSPEAALLRRADTALKRAQRTNRPQDWDAYEQLIIQAEDASANSSGLAGQNIRPVYLRARSPADWNDVGRVADMDGQFSSQIEQFQRDGADAVRLNRIQDAATLNDTPTNHVVVSRADQIVPAIGGAAQLDELFQVPLFREAVESAQGSARARDGVNVVVDGQVSPDALQRVYSQLGRMARSARQAGDNVREGDLLGLQGRLRSFIDAQYPGGIHEAARTEAAQRFASQEAMDLGRDIFRLENARNPEALARRVQAMSPEELQRFRIGVARGVVDQMNTAPRSTVPVNGQVIASEARDASNPISRFWNRADRQEALRAAFANEAEFERFVRAMAIEGDRAAIFPRISPRTQGSSSIANARAGAVSDGIQDIADTASGNWLSPVLRRFQRSAAQGNPMQEIEIQRILWDTVPNRRAELISQLEIRGLISRQQGQSLRASLLLAAPTTAGAVNATQN